jgi:putative transposase
LHSRAPHVTVPGTEPATVQEELPAWVQEALGELASAAREGLLALSVGVGLGVLAKLMEEEVAEVVGSKGKHNAERVAVRHGHEWGEVTLGGRRVGVERPRVRSADGSSELPLASYSPRPRPRRLARRRGWLGWFLFAPANAAGGDRGG